jgi:5-(carboxyamino)imidazole ribonucleotide synthase
METSKQPHSFEPRVIGVIGGGQLGKMFIQKASQWSVPVNILDRDVSCPASPYAHQQVVGSITDAGEIERLSAISDILTWEIEHINADKLIALQQQGKRIIPDPKILKIIQNKAWQKEFYKSHDIPTSPFFIGFGKTDVRAKLAASAFRKVAVKSATGGYDGKGVFISDSKNILKDEAIIPFDGEMMVEEFVECKTEIAVLVARDLQGQMCVYPPIEMEFDPKSNLVSFLISPANIPFYLEERSKQIALQCAEAFGSAGLFAVEMFLSENDDLLVNEIAPRPHNSAHHTIEGFYISQYEQLLRILTGMPLGTTEMKMPCAMINLTGPEGRSGKYRLKYFNELAGMQGVYIHLYGKETSKPNRKLGHITVVHPTRQMVLEITQKIRPLTEIEITEEE